MDTYKPFESSYDSDSNVALLDDPVKSARSSSLDDNILSQVDTVVTEDETLARDYIQYSGE